MAKSTQKCQNHLPPKPTHLNKIQTHPIINWVKWVLIQLNSININVYWVLIGYPIRPNYGISIISTNHPTLKYPKPLKGPKHPLNLKNYQNTPLDLQNNTNSPRNLKFINYPPKSIK